MKYSLQKTLTRLTAIAAVVVMTGCASHGAALIKSVPAGAEVVNLEDDTILGITPIKVWWQDSDAQRKFVNIRLQKSGYDDKTASFWVSLRHGSRGSAMKDPQFVEVELEKEN